MNDRPNEVPQVTWKGYLALLLAVLFFSGLFAKSPNWLKVLDFTALNGSFGTIAEQFTFRGSGGVGARDGFLFSLELMPAVILALGIIRVVEGFGGLEAARQLLTPLLRPLLGIPGAAGLALVASLQSTDAGAVMTKQLVESRQLTDDERTVFATWQMSADATITNYFSSGAALFAFLLVPIVIPLLVMFVFKFVGATLMRLYLRRVGGRRAA
ncbi:MAG TPA: nucleoside recognition domain-containing protein [Symbiobacteriaceae bacterium]